MKPNFETSPTSRHTPVDSSGYRIFATDEIGDAHVMAHRMLDQGAHDRGHRLLGEWLRGRHGEGSRWVHLQFHMAVFELAVGDWKAAHRRYLAEVLPVAAGSTEALTDAPQLAWRLALAAPERIELHWNILRDTALSAPAEPQDAWTDLHNVLAIAGAGDLDGLQSWAPSNRFSSGRRPSDVARDLAWAMSAYVSRNRELAAHLLEDLATRTQQTGGSRAQNELFVLLARSSRRDLSSSVGRLH